MASHKLSLPPEVERRVETVRARSQPAPSKSAVLRALVIAGLPAFEGAPVGVHRGEGSAPGSPAGGPV